MNDYERYILAPWHKKRNLEELYNEKGYSSREIAQMYRVDHMTILKWMKRFRINRRGSGGTSSKWNNRMYRNRHYLKQQYVTLKLSTIKIAKKEDVYPSVIRHWLIKFNIPRRRHKWQ